MDERSATHDAVPAIPLGLALAQLPMEAPVRDAWPLLSRRLAARQRASRWPASRWSMAIAASLLAGLLAIPFDASGPGASAPGTASPGTAPPGTAPSATATSAPDADAAARKAQLAALMSESQRLERLVTAVDQGTSSATAAAMRLEYDDGLHAIDSALQATRDPARQLDLWQQRVQMLRETAAVETSRRYLASEGRVFDVALVTAY